MSSPKPILFSLSCTFFDAIVIIIVIIITIVTIRTKERCKILKKALDKRLLICYNVNMRRFIRVKYVGKETLRKDEMLFYTRKRTWFRRIPKVDKVK